MKKYLLILSFFFSLHVQAQSCTTAVAQTVFQQNRRSIEVQQNDLQKLNVALNFVRNNCLNTLQLITLMEMLRTDADKLQLAKNAYPNVVDKANTYDLYDAFDYFSTAFRFYDFIHGIPDPSGGMTGGGTPTTTCNNLMNASEWASAKPSITRQTLEQNKIETAKQIIRSKCMTSEQIKEIALLLYFEQSRLEIAKFAYDFVYDRSNYYVINQVFKHSASVTDLTEYVKSKQ